MATQPSVEIKVQLRLICARMPLKALADVTLLFGEAQVRIRRCPVFEQLGLPPWANLPMLPVQTCGKHHLAPIVELGGDLKQRVLRAILDSYRHGR